MTSFTWTASKDLLYQLLSEKGLTVKGIFASTASKARFADNGNAVRWDIRKCNFKTAAWKHESGIQL